MLDACVSTADGCGLSTVVVTLQERSCRKRNAWKRAGLRVAFRLGCGRTHRSSSSTSAAGERTLFKVFLPRCVTTKYLRSDTQRVSNPFCWRVYSPPTLRVLRVIYVRFTNTYFRITNAFLESKQTQSSQCHRKCPFRLSSKASGSATRIRHDGYVKPVSQLADPISLRSAPCKLLERIAL